MYVCVSMLKLLFCKLMYLNIRAYIHYMYTLGNYVHIDVHTYRILLFIRSEKVSLLHVFIFIP